MAPRLHSRVEAFLLIQMASFLLGDPMTTKRAILRTLLALTSACTLTLSVAQEPESSMTRVQRTKVLRVGAIAGAIPYFSKDLVSGKWEGFGPDFSESLAKKFGAK